MTRFHYFCIFHCTYVCVCSIFFIRSSDRAGCCLVAQSCPTLCNPWTVAHQVPLSMEFSRQEYWSGLPFPSPNHLYDPGIEPRSPTLWAESYLASFLSTLGSTLWYCIPNHPKISSLKQHTFITSQFLWVINLDMARSSSSGSLTRLQSSISYLQVQLELALRPAYSLVVRKISSLQIVWLRASMTCWPLTRGCPSSPPCHMGLSMEWLKPWQLASLELMR